MNHQTNTHLTILVRIIHNNPTEINQSINNLISKLMHLKVISKIFLFYKKIFLTVIMHKISINQTVISNLTKLILNQTHLSNPIKISFQIRIQELSSLAKANLQTLLRNSKKRDKKIHNDLFLTINYQKRSFMNNLSQSIIIQLIIKVIKLIIMEQLPSEQVWVKECQVKITSIGKIQVKRNFLILILRLHPHQKTNKKW